MICRLCGGPTKPMWLLRVMHRHTVNYHECEDCGSLQTDEPHWLDEAYARRGADLDTGMAQRNVSLVIAMHAILDLIGFDKERPCFDFAAGIGLYARMMRDRGYNYWAADKHGTPYLMDNFVGDRPGWDLVSAFEVAEHLPDPKATWPVLFGLRPDYLFFTTELYERQGPDWYYLAPEEGQHVFFYTASAVERLGAAHGYNYRDLGHVKLFLRRGVHLPAMTFEGIGIRGMELFATQQRAPWENIQRDNAALRARPRT